MTLLQVLRNQISIYLLITISQAAQAYPNTALKKTPFNYKPTEAELASSCAAADGWLWTMEYEKGSRSFCQARNGFISPDAIFWGQENAKQIEELRAVERGKENYLNSEPFSNYYDTNKSNQVTAAKALLEESEKSPTEDYESTADICKRLEGKEERLKAEFAPDWNLCVFADKSYILSESLKRNSYYRTAKLRSLIDRTGMLNEYECFDSITNLGQEVGISSKNGEVFTVVDFMGVNLLVTNGGEYFRWNIRTDKNHWSTITPVYALTKGAVYLLELVDPYVKPYEDVTNYVEYRSKNKVPGHGWVYTRVRIPKKHGVKGFVKSEFEQEAKEKETYRELGTKTAKGKMTRAPILGTDSFSEAMDSSVGNALNNAARQYVEAKKGGKAPNAEKYVRAAEICSTITRSNPLDNPLFKEIVEDSKRQNKKK
jgi:hypothetical protein